MCEIYIYIISSDICSCSVQCLTRCRAELVGAQLLHLRLDWRPPIEQTRHHILCNQHHQFYLNLYFCATILSFYAMSSRSLCEQSANIFPLFSIERIFLYLQSSPPIFSDCLDGKPPFRQFCHHRASSWVNTNSQERFFFLILTTIKFYGTTVKINICWRIWCSSWRKN